MSLSKKIKKYVLHPLNISKYFSVRKMKGNYGKKLSDEEYIAKMFKLKLGYDIDLSNPKTFNEKLNYLKLNYRKPILTKMVDKHEAKRIVSDIVGEQFVVKEYGLFDKADDIEFDILPNEFVLKTTHFSGGVIICKDKEKFDSKAATEKLNKLLKQNYYYNCREWPYKDIEPKVIVEKYITDGINDVLPVYKFFCFDGKPVLLQAIKNDKQKTETIDYFDMDWNMLELRQNYPNSDTPLNKPINFEEMKEIAERLSKGFPFIRVDLYSVNGKTLFSEFTFFSDAGFERFYPEEWDEKLGAMIKISDK